MAREVKVLLAGMEAKPFATIRDKDGTYRQGISAYAADIADGEDTDEDPQLTEWLTQADNAQLFADVQHSCSVDGFLPGDDGVNPSGITELDWDEDPEACLVRLRQEAAALRETIMLRQERIDFRRDAYAKGTRPVRIGVLKNIEKRQQKDQERLAEIECVLNGAHHPEIDIRVTYDPLPTTSAALAKQTGLLH